MIYSFDLLNDLPVDRMNSLYEVYFPVYKWTWYILYEKDE